MTVLAHERFQESESEEFLQPEEQKEMDGGEEQRPVFGNIDPEFKDQGAEDILAVDSVSGYKYQIVNNIWTPFARGLWQKFAELQQCNPSTILFVRVEDAKPKYRGRPKYMETAVISARWQDLLEQLTGKTFGHVITIYGGNVDKFEQSHEQMLVHLYNAMRMINADGSLRSYDINAFTEVYASLRADWDREHTHLPNLLETGNWLGMHKMQGQLWGEDRSGENELAKDF